MTQKLAQRNYYGKALAKLAETDPKVVAMDADDKMLALAFCRLDHIQMACMKKIVYAVRIADFVFFHTITPHLQEIAVSI